MKTIEQLLALFSPAKPNQKKNNEYLSGAHWKIIMYSPFTVDGLVKYTFRIYGKASGSKFSENNGLNWCGGVDYYHDPKTNQLKRETYKHELHPVMKLHIVLEEVFEKI